MREVLMMLAVVPALVACTGTTDADGGLDVRTARAQYTVFEEITAMVTNRGRRDVFVAHCNHRLSLGVERRNRETWVSHAQVNGPQCQGIYPMGDSVVRPGQRITETFRITEAGQYRLRLYGRAGDEDFGSLAALSPPFSVGYPPD